MIPQENSEAVTRGLREAFGVIEFEDIRQLTKGHTTSLVFRIVVRGSPYLLKIIIRADSPARNYSNMTSAAGAGIAPRVWYANVDDKVSITDFIDETPFSRTEALARMPAVLRTLHALPPFAPVPGRINTTCTFLLNQNEARDGYFQRIRAANILPRNELDQLFDWYAQIAAVYPHHDPDLVSSHNDLLKPDNILFDGDSVWLVDWEAAFFNDRYVDLAQVAHLIVSDDAEEAAFLRDYFGQPPDPYQQARFFLMDQLTHIFYAMAFLWMGSMTKPIDWSEPVPTFPEFQRRVWAGELNLADIQTRVIYGRVHWERILHNAQQPKFTEALRFVADRNAVYANICDMGA